MNSGQFLLQPLTLFILAVLALLIVSAVQLWRIGAFEPIFGDKAAVVDRGSKRWMMNGRAAPAADHPLDTAEPANEDDEPLSDE